MTTEDRRLVYRYGDSNPGPVAENLGPTAITRDQALSFLHRSRSHVVSRGRPFRTDCRGLPSTSFCSRSRMFTGRKFTACHSLHLLSRSISVAKALRIASGPVRRAGPRLRSRSTRGKRAGRLSSKKWSDSIVPGGLGWRLFAAGRDHERGQRARNEPGAPRDCELHAGSLWPLRLAACFTARVRRG